MYLVKVFVRLKYKNSKIQIYQLEDNALEININVLSSHEGKIGFPNLFVTH